VETIPDGLTRTAESTRSLTHYLMCQ